MYNSFWPLLFSYVENKSDEIKLLYNGGGDGGDGNNAGTPRGNVTLELSWTWNLIIIFVYVSWQRTFLFFGSWKTKLLETLLKNCILYGGEFSVK